MEILELMTLRGILKGQAQDNIKKQGDRKKIERRRRKAPVKVDFGRQTPHHTNVQRNQKDDTEKIDRQWMYKLKRRRGFVCNGHNNEQTDRMCR